MMEPFDIFKLIKSFNPFVGENIGKMLFVALIAGIIFAFGIKITQPTSTETYGAGSRKTEININKEPEVPLMGCSMWRVNVKLYWQKAPSKGREVLEKKSSN